MRPLHDRRAARAFDEDACARTGLPSLLLMENAGRGAADVVRACAPRGVPVVVLGGVGQNGGDAWVVARHLVAAGVSVRCVRVDDADRNPRADAAAMVRAWVGLGAPLGRARPDDAALHASLVDAVVVDGVFGTGLDRPVSEAYVALFEALRAARDVTSLDLPSGLCADTGMPLGAAVSAHRTVSFGAAKLGLAIGLGPTYAGDVYVAGLGVAPSPHATATLVRVDPADVPRWLPRRGSACHKGDAGRVLVFSGAPGTVGAARLAARAAHRAGAGLVALATSTTSRAALDASLVETMSRVYDDTAGALALCAHVDAAVLGPGFGAEEDDAARVVELALGARCPLVLDADALRAFEPGRGPGASTSLATAPAPRVLTPHEAEAARLLGIPHAELARDRVAAARTLARTHGAVVALKGASTVVADPDGQVRVVVGHHPALGVGGSGDVLAGMIAAVLAERRPHVEVLDLVAATVAWHRAAADVASRADRGVLAGELADALPEALGRLRARPAAPDPSPEWHDPTRRP